MSKKANPTTVGAFIVGAVVLAVGGILTFGGGTLFQEEYRYVAYFDDSVAGLDLGAPVRFQGVQVGTVSSINAVWDDSDERVRIPVELEFVLGSVQHSHETRAFDDPVGLMQTLIDKGLRAELTLDSFVTGKLFVALKLYPDSQPDLVGGTQLPEMPTVVTPLARLAKSIADIPFEDLVERAIVAVDSVTTLVNDPATAELRGNLNSLVRDVSEHVGPLADSTQATLDEARQLMRSADGELAAVSRDLRKLLADADERIEPTTVATIAALDQARETIARIDAALGEGHKLPYRAGGMIDEMTAAARAFRVLAEMIERNPEALLSGKPGR